MTNLLTHMRMRRIERKLMTLLSIVYDKPLPPPSCTENIFLSELQETFRDLPKLEPTNESLSDTAWVHNMNRLRQLVLNQDPRQFLRWDVISNTMFVSNAHYIFTELKHLKHCSDWNTRWRSAIKETSVGHPIPYFLYPASSGNLIHHAYHLSQFEENTLVKIHDVDFVFEVGGGYGSMCRLVHNLGFRGKYVIFDLPPFSALQIYYLKTLGLPVQSSIEFAHSKNGIVCVSNIETLKNILADNIQVTNKMFIATWSISETSKTTRDTLLSLVSDYQSFLIVYQDKFGEINNLDYFDKWKECVGNVAWRSWQIKHMPGNTYLVGVASP